jgi:hypothetical protein
MQVLPQCGHAVHEDSPDKVDIQSNLPMWSPIFKDHFSDRFYVQWQSTPLYCMKCLILQDDCKYEYSPQTFVTSLLSKNLSKILIFTAFTQVDYCTNNPRFPKPFVHSKKFPKIFIFAVILQNETFHTIQGCGLPLYIEPERKEFQNLVFCMR